MSRLISTSRGCRRGVARSVLSTLCALVLAVSSGSVGRASPPEAGRAATFAGRQTIRQPATAEVPCDGSYKDPGYPGVRFFNYPDGTWQLHLPDGRVFKARYPDDGNLTDAKGDIWGGLNIDHGGFSITLFEKPTSQWTEAERRSRTVSRQEFNLRPCGGSGSPSQTPRPGDTPLVLPVPVKPAPTPTGVPPFEFSFERPEGLTTDGRSFPPTSGEQLMIAEDAALTSVSDQSSSRDESPAWRIIGRPRIVWLPRPTHGRPDLLRTRLVPDTSVTLRPGSIVHLESDGQGSADAPGRLVVSLVATGASSGEAVRAQIVNRMGRAATLRVPDGLVLQPIRADSTRSVVARTKQAPQTLPLNAYCLEFTKLPPAQGTLFRIAEQSLQDRFRPLRHILAATRALESEGRLHPDVGATLYGEATRQWALWTRLEKWTADDYVKNVIERAKKNVREMKRPWTKPMEEALRSAAPGRWRDIVQVLERAEQIEKEAGDANPGRPR